MLESSFKSVLRDFTLDVGELNVGDGKTLALIGENGAGKSTVLKILSGLIRPASGRIVLNGRVLCDIEQGVFVAPEDRNIGYMFQNYALFPHMTVAANIAYGLKARKMPQEEIDKRVRELCERMGIDGIMNERVTRLSGGQRQRTALARAIAPRPGLLLLDEPLAALDVRTQEQMRRELASVIRTEGIPCIIVTHSIVDALAVADSMAVIDNGKIVAAGSPEEVIHNPSHGFVSSFAENLNLFRGEVLVENGGTVCVDIAGVKVRAVTTLSGTVSVGIRPEELIISREKFQSSAANAFRGRITSIEDNGSYAYVYADIGITLAAAITRQSISRLDLKVGDEVTVTFKATAVQVFV